MSIRDIIFVVLALGCVAFGISLKYERRAELRETRQNAKLAEIQLKEDLATAKRRANSSLESFLVAAKHVSGADATLKVRVQTGNSSEHIWVRDFKPTKYIGNKAITFEGALSNQPKNMPGMSAGDTLTFSNVAIEDWGLFVNGEGYGFFSVRAIAPTLEASEAAQLTSFLAPKPLPDDWEEIRRALEPAEPYVDPRDRFMQHLTNVPETWDRAMVLVYSLKIEKKPNGGTVGYAQATWVDSVENTEDGKLRGIPLRDALFDQAYVNVEPIVFDRRDIRDWGFVENGRGYGFSTLRKNQGSLSPLQKQNLASFFSKDLLPVGW